MSGQRFHPREMVLTTRMSKGYRYLDKCGEVLLNLEEALGDGWLPADPAAQSGNLKHLVRGIEVSFDTRAISLRMREGVDATEAIELYARTYEIVCGLLQIDTITAPTLRCIWVKVCGTLEEADSELISLGLVSPSERLLRSLGGPPTVLHTTLIRESSAAWDGLPIPQRVRIEATAMKQYNQPPFDKRLLQRSRLLPTHQREALQALVNLRSLDHPLETSKAILDIEHSFEADFSYRAFNCREFLEHSWECVRNIEVTLTEGKHS